MCVKVALSAARSGENLFYSCSNSCGGARTRKAPTREVPVCPHRWKRPAASACRPRQLRAGPARSTGTSRLHPALVCLRPPQKIKKAGTANDVNGRPHAYAQPAYRHLDALWQQSGDFRGLGIGRHGGARRQLYRLGQRPSAVIRMANVPDARAGLQTHKALRKTGACSAPRNRLPESEQASTDLLLMRQHAGFRSA